MKNYLKIIFISFIFFFNPGFLLAQNETESLQGLVRSVQTEGKSFTLDVPPLTRMIVNASSRFEAELGPKAFLKLNEGDKIEVKGKRSANGVLVVFEAKLLQKFEKTKEGYFLNKSFNLALLATLELSDAPIHLKSLEFIDSLCQEGRNCEGEGEVGARVEIKVGNKKKEFLFSSGGSRKPLKPIVKDFEGYHFEVLEFGETSAIFIIRKNP